MLSQVIYAVLFTYWLQLVQLVEMPFKCQWRSTLKCSNFSGSAQLSCKQTLSWLQSNVETNHSYHIRKEAGVAENLERHSNDESSKEEQTGKQEHISCICRTVTITTKQYTVQLLAFTPVQCSPVNHIFCIIPTTAICNNTAQSCDISKTSKQL